MSGNFATVLMKVRGQGGLKAELGGNSELRVRVRLQESVDKGEG